MDTDTVPIFIGARGHRLPILNHHDIVLVHDAGIDARAVFFMVPRVPIPFNPLHYAGVVMQCMSYYNDLARFNNAVRAAKLISQSTVEKLYSAKYK